jgi:hypothetical protein
MGTISYSLELAIVFLMAAAEQIISIARYRY